MIRFTFNNAVIGASTSLYDDTVMVPMDIWSPYGLEWVLSSKIMSIISPPIFFEISSSSSEWLVAPPPHHCASHLNVSLPDLYDIPLSPWRSRMDMGLLGAGLWFIVSLKLLGLWDALLAALWLHLPSLRYPLTHQTGISYDGAPVYRLVFLCFLRAWRTLFST